MLAPNHTVPTLPTLQVIVPIPTHPFPSSDNDTHDFPLKIAISDDLGWLRYQFGDGEIGQNRG
jgi:hypothetical protein